MADIYQVEKNFSTLLREKSPSLSSRLDYIKQKGLEEWVPLLGFEKGAHAGYPHLMNVERNANKMIPDQIKDGFSAGEIFLLLASIFLHDIGKLVSDENHNKESRKIIEECWAELGLPDERIARYCAQIAYYHGKYDPFEEDEDIRDYNMTSLEPYGTLRIPLLAAILRIADETENLWTRSLQQYLYKRLNKKTTVELVKGVRRFIEDIEFCLEGECIILHVPGGDQDKKNTTKNTNYIKHFHPFQLKKEEIPRLNEMKEKIVQVLKFWSPLLEEENIHFNQVFFEHKNVLLESLKYDEAKEGIEIECKISEIFKKDETDNRPGVQELIDAIVGLFLGSLGHNTFSWQALEAKVGQALSDREKWIMKRLNYIKSGFYITFHPEDKIKIKLERNKIKDVYQQLGCTYRR